jgi:Protein of unknown function (DUF2726)
LNTPVLLPVLLLSAAIVLLLVWRYQAKPRTPGPWPFYAKKPLPSAHQVLYHRLVSALPGYTVLAGVELAMVLEVKRGADAAPWKRRIRHLQYDFVVCAQDASVLAVIVLGSAEGAASRLSRAEETRRRASAAAGLRLLRWHSRVLPDTAAIQTMFGVPQTPHFDDMPFSTNASWWPPMASTPGVLPSKG